MCFSTSRLQQVEASKIQAAPGWFSRTDHPPCLASAAQRARQNRQNNVSVPLLGQQVQVAVLVA
jgi:hypothetical protein